MIVSTWSGIVDTDWGMYYFADTWPSGEPAGEDGGFGAAAATGFLGMRAPW